MFEVLDGRIPPNWTVSGVSNDALDDFNVGPASWATPGFWVRIDDDYGDPTGQLYAEYQRELQVILEHARTPPHGGPPTVA